MQMQPVEIIVTNRLQTGTTFAVRADAMTENIFIPSKLALEANVRPGMKIMANLVPNIQQPDKTPWLCIALHGSEKDATSDTSLRDRIRAELGNGAATVYELANALGAEVRDVEAELRTMRLPHTELWALDAMDLRVMA
jgi:hypothetical protein